MSKERTIVLATCFNMGKMDRIFPPSCVVGVLIKGKKKLVRVIYHSNVMTSTDEALDYVDTETSEVVLDDGKYINDFSINGKDYLLSTNYDIFLCSTMGDGYNTQNKAHAVLDDSIIYSYLHPKSIQPSYVKKAYEQFKANNKKENFDERFVIIPTLFSSNNFRHHDTNRLDTGLIDFEGKIVVRPEMQARQLNSFFMEVGGRNPSMGWIGDKIFELSDGILSWGGFKDVLSENGATFLTEVRCSNDSKGLGLGDYVITPYLDSIIEEHRILRFGNKAYLTVRGRKEIGEYEQNHDTGSHKQIYPIEYSLVDGKVVAKPIPDLLGEVSDWVGEEPITVLNNSIIQLMGVVLNLDIEIGGVDSFVRINEETNTRQIGIFEYSNTFDFNDHNVRMIRNIGRRYLASLVKNYLENEK